MNPSAFLRAGLGPKSKFGRFLIVILPHNKSSSINVCAFNFSCSVISGFFSPAVGNSPATGCWGRFGTNFYFFSVHFSFFSPDLMTNFRSFLRKSCPWVGFNSVHEKLWPLSWFTILPWIKSYLDPKRTLMFVNDHREKNNFWTSTEGAAQVFLGQFLFFSSLLETFLPPELGATVTPFSSHISAIRTIPASLWEIRAELLQLRDFSLPGWVWLLQF